MKQVTRRAKLFLNPADRDQAPSVLGSPGDANYGVLAQLTWLPITIFLPHSQLFPWFPDHEEGKNVGEEKDEMEGEKDKKWNV